MSTLAMHYWSEKVRVMACGGAPSLSRFGPVPKNGNNSFNRNLTFYPSKTAWKIGFSNVNSLLGKRDFVKAEILSDSYDFFGIVESKIDCTISSSEISVPNYVIFRSDRTKRGGGLAAYVRHGTLVIQLKPPKDYGIDRTDLETLILRLGSGPSEIIIILVYIPRQNALRSKHYMNIFFVHSKIDFID